MLRRFVCAVVLALSATWCVRDAAADVITFDQAISSDGDKGEGTILPEPTALLLLGTALVLFAMATRRNANR
jgi:hypothetical protein